MAMKRACEDVVVKEAVLAALAVPTEIVQGQRPADWDGFWGEAKERLRGDGARYYAAEGPVEVASTLMMRHCCAAPPEAEEEEQEQQAAPRRARR